MTQKDSAVAENCCTFKLFCTNLKFRIAVQTLHSGLKVTTELKFLNMAYNHQSMLTCSA